MALFKTPEELQRAMVNDLGDVVLDVAILSKDIVTKNVWDVVYQPYSPQQYERLGWEGGFVGSWDIRPEDSLLPKDNAMSYRIFSNADKMRYIPETYTHGDDSGTNDRRSIMDVAIAEGRFFDFRTQLSQQFYDFYGEESDWWTLPRDYFTPSLKQISSDMDDMVQTAYKMRNVTALPDALAKALFK